MKLGYNTGYWSAGPPEGVEKVIAECDKLGFEHIWTAEAYGSDCSGGGKLFQTDDVSGSNMDQRCQKHDGMQL